MSDDIVKKRLLRTDGYDLLREEPIYVNPDGPKAADEIERLRAELAAEREANAVNQVAIERFCQHESELRTAIIKAVDDLVTIELEQEIYAAQDVRKELADALNNGGGDE